MPAERKWVYWHRVVSVVEEADVKVGDLIGLKQKDTSMMRMVWDKNRETFDLKDCANLKFLGRMLRTTPAAEVHAAFKGM